MTERCGIICAGNWIVDIVHTIDQWPREGDLVRVSQQETSIGGGAANVIFALVRLDTGLPLWPIGAFGDDDYGRYIARACRDLGLPVHLFRLKEGIPTAHTHVMSVSGQSRTFFYQGGANDVLSQDAFAPEDLASTNARIFYLGYLTLLAALDRVESPGSSAAATVLSRARDSGMVTCVDLASVDRPDFARCLAPALPYIDYLILNEVELARASGNPMLSQTIEPSDEELLRMAMQLIDAGVRQAVIVHCPQKALWVGSDGHVHSAPVDPLTREEVASPLGAGDAFCSGIVYALHQGWTPSKAIELGHAVARESLRSVTATEAIPRLEDLVGSSVLQQGIVQNDAH